MLVQSLRYAGAHVQATSHPDRAREIAASTGRGLPPRERRMNAR